jgi:hypothetical protein
MSPSLNTLPPELYPSILRHIPKESLAHTVYYLIRAFPSASIPRSYLFRFIYLRHASQILQLYLRLRQAPHEASLVSELSIEVWRVDADVVVNLMRLLRRLIRLSLFIGITYAPEHLEVSWHNFSLAMLFNQLDIANI